MSYVLDLDTAPQAPWRRALFSLGMRLQHALALTDRLPTPDRRLLEEVILPHYAQRADIRRVLFVGCSWYTQAYERLFAHAEYWTLERSPHKARYGARRHVTASVEQLAAYFAPRSFDLIVCNGVFGWGLNQRAACERAFAQCHDALRPGGELVLGWNDVPRYRPCDPRDFAALRCFEALRFAPCDAQQRVLVPRTNRHTYDFWRRHRQRDLNLGLHVFHTAPAP